MKLHKVSDKLLVGHAGLAADAMMVIGRLKDKELKNEEDIMSAIREIYWSHTTKKDIRPLGAGLLVATLFSRPRLFEVDTSGAIMEFVADAIGEGGEAAKAIFSKGYKKMSLKDAGKMISSVLGEGKEYSVETLRLD